MTIHSLQTIALLLVFMAMYKTLAPIVQVGGDLSREPADESDGELELAPIHNGGGKYALLPDSDMGEMAETKNVTSSFLADQGTCM